MLFLLDDAYFLFFLNALRWHKMKNNQICQIMQLLPVSNASWEKLQLSFPRLHVSKWFSEQCFPANVSEGLTCLLEEIIHLQPPQPGELSVKGTSNSTVFKVQEVDFHFYYSIKLRPSSRVFSPRCVRRYWSWFTAFTLILLHLSTGDSLRHHHTVVLP